MDFVSVLYVEENSLRKSAFLKTGNGCAASAMSVYAVRNTVFESVDICDNTVNIELKDGIVHTKWDSFRDIYIVPLMQGEFKAKVTLMCAEYEDPEETEITFVCE